MDTATSVGPTAAAPARGRSARSVVRRSWVLVLALVVVVVAWRIAVTALYVSGLALTVVGVLVVLRGRRNWAVGASAVVVVLGLGGPWLGVRLAYRPVGVAVSGSVESYSEYLTSVGDVTLLTHRDSVLAVGDSGATAWQTDVPDLSGVWPLTDGRLLVRADGELVAIAGDAEGERGWSRPLVAGEDTLVAVSADVVVQRSCVKAEGAVASCTWAGVDLADGAGLWEVEGAWAPGWPVRSGRPSTSVSIVHSLETSLFTVRGERGEIDVHDADTGQTVQVLRGPDVSPVLVGDAALVFRTGGTCSVELVRTAGSQWTSEYPCALWDEPEYDFSWGGSRVGDAYWGEPIEGRGTLVVDLGDGTVRNEGASYERDIYPFGFEDREPVEVLGAGLDVQVRSDGLVGRDPVDGTARWEVGVPGANIRSVQAAGGVVVMTRYQRPLLLHEWFAPEDPRTVVVEVLDAVSGERRAVVRTADMLGGPVLVGDRVLLEVADVSGERTMRLIGR
ncbi:hypothetical protein [Pengzhenrongella frigida]|uniref:Uncharacterized protein n=1 Tax=Pengzhenrongella frigida TaxID=1259133 RepID=A0A4Q5MYA9_9MICO|nr:hypothetical protein [Cellulomonas sp. HLT2-17]RYV50626.1 hypothetical protein EUA98_12855 [Cellulomonas sp. HLT2-17]